MDVDFAAVTSRQQKMWSLGDFGKVGSLLSMIGESLVFSLDVHAGERVLDVAGGNGSASLPAARRFADVLTTDFVAELLAEAELRARADGVSLRTQVADAQALTYDDGSFDVVMSTIGAMFAPDQEATAREMTRVCRSRGRIGMANWTPDSMVGDMFRILSAHVPPPAGVAPAALWGTEDRVRELLGPWCREITCTRKVAAFRFPSSQAFLDYFRQFYGPTVAAFAAVERDVAEVMAGQLLAMLDGHNTAADGTLAMDVPYLEVIAIRD